MLLEFDRIEREFSAAEVAEFFGVPEMIQRDWRRRFQNTSFFRPAERGKRFMWTLDEACALSLAKVQSDAGKSVLDAIWVGSMCTAAAILNIEMAAQAVEFEGLDTTPAMRRDLLLSLNDLTDSEVYTKYLFFPIKDDLHAPLFPDLKAEPGPTAYHFASLAEMEKQVTHDWVHGQIFDLCAFAFSLAAKMRGEKIVTYRKVGGAA